MLPRRPRLMFVGEQPEDQEDRQGRPFVGPARETERFIDDLRLVARTMSKRPTPEKPI